MVFIGTKAKLVCSRTTLLSPAAVSRGCIPPQQIVELAEFFLVCPWACFLLAETFSKAVCKHIHRPYGLQGHEPPLHE